MMKVGDMAKYGEALSREILKGEIAIIMA